MRHPRFLALAALLSLGLMPAMSAGSDRIGSCLTFLLVPGVSTQEDVRLLMGDPADKTRLTVAKIQKRWREGAKARMLPCARPGRDDIDVWYFDTYEYLPHNQKRTKNHEGAYIAFNEDGRVCAAIEPGYLWW